MSDVNLIAGDVMDRSSSLLNDTAKSTFTYSVQLPYLNIALEELQNEYELNEMPVTETVTSNPIVVAANIKAIGFSPTVPALPSDLIEPLILWERPSGIDPYIPMTKVQYLPRYMEGSKIPQLVWYTWESNEIRFLPANAANDVKMDYIRSLFITITASTDKIAVINAEAFLFYRTAALCSRFIGENPTRADSLDSMAQESLNRIVGVGTKGKQNIITRRRPFRAGFKRRVYM